jgi:glycosyltransferase involved in cell wall biosynthesis
MEARTTVLVNAGPWLAVPPRDYGGIEAVVASLVGELRTRGVRVVLATVGESSLPADRYVTVFERGQFAHIAEPYNRTMGIAHAHMQGVVAELERACDIDLVHDHLEVVGPSVLRAMGPAAPPVLQTLHWDTRKHPQFYGSFDGGGRVLFAGVSARQVELAPARLREQTIGAVPLGVPLDDFDCTPRKDGYALVLARITAVKGQDVAARACRDRGVELRMAGPVAGACGPAELEAQLADPASALHGNRDVDFYLLHVRPLEGPGRRWIGSVSGARKRELIARARVLLCPISWDEPGGTAVVEALASGTPVIGFGRGCLPTLVDHGVTGFIADDEDELGAHLDRVGELDPAACRAAAVSRFSSGAMAERYIELYDEVLRRAGRVRPLRAHLEHGLNHVAPASR